VDGAVLTLSGTHLQKFVLFIKLFAKFYGCLMCFRVLKRIKTLRDGEYDLFWNIRTTLPNKNQEDHYSLLVSWIDGSRGVCKVLIVRCLPSCVLRFALESLSVLTLYEVLIRDFQAFTTESFRNIQTDTKFWTIYGHVSFLRSYDASFFLHSLPSSCV
jgi:hypothetical protein